MNKTGERRRGRTENIWLNSFLYLHRKSRGLFCCSIKVFWKWDLSSYKSLIDRQLCVQICHLMVKRVEVFKETVSRVMKSVQALHKMFVFCANVNVEKD